MKFQRVFINKKSVRWAGRGRLLPAAKEPSLNAILTFLYKAGLFLVLAIYLLSSEYALPAKINWAGEWQRPESSKYD